MLIKLENHSTMDINGKFIPACQAFEPLNEDRYAEIGANQGVIASPNPSDGSEGNMVPDDLPTGGGGGQQGGGQQGGGQQGGGGSVQGNTQS